MGPQGCDALCEKKNWPSLRPSCKTIWSNQTQFFENLVRPNLPNGKYWSKICTQQRTEINAPRKSRDQRGVTSAMHASSSSKTGGYAQQRQVSEYAKWMDGAGDKGKEGEEAGEAGNAEDYTTKLTKLVGLQCLGYIGTWIHYSGSMP